MDRPFRMAPARSGESAVRPSRPARNRRRPCTSPSPIRLRFIQKPRPLGVAQRQVAERHVAVAFHLENAAGAGQLVERSGLRSRVATADIPTPDSMPAQLLPLPMDGALAQQQQRLVEHEAADADDEDRGIDVREGEARARDGDVVAEPAESPIISVSTTTMIAIGSAMRRPEKMLGSAAGKITRRRMVRAARPCSRRSRSAASGWRESRDRTSPRSDRGIRGT